MSTPHCNESSTVNLLPQVDRVFFNAFVNAQRKAQFTSADSKRKSWRESSLFWSLVWLGVASSFTLGEVSSFRSLLCFRWTRHKKDINQHLSRKWRQLPPPQLWEEFPSFAAAGWQMPLLRKTEIHCNSNMMHLDSPVPVSHTSSQPCGHWSDPLPTGQLLKFKPLMGPMYSTYRLWGKLWF